MGKAQAMKGGVWAALLAGVIFGLGSAAWATTGQDGPTPPKPGDPVGTNVAPHGGYSSTTNFCLQCHEVHKAPGAYALMWKTSVTATCATCHGLNGQPASGTRDPVGPGTVGTASSRSAYDVTSPISGHTIGGTTPPDETGITITESDWSYSWRYSGGPPAQNATSGAGPGTASDISGGLYCASCHTPHGDYGQAANTKKVVTSSDGTFDTQTTVPWQEGQQIWWKDPSTGVWAQKYLHLDTDPAVWEVCDGTNPTPVQGEPDSGCAYAQVKDAEGQLVYLYAYKMLSMYPNHTYATPQSYGVDKYDHDGMRWCGVCHPSRIDTSAGGTYHNHPTGCSACHGNPANGSSADFPHTSTNSSLLKDYPDALCVSCHTFGSLP